MARLWMGGAEWNDGTADGIFGSAVTSTSTVRSGSRSWNPASTAAVGVLFTAVAAHTYYCRIYFNIAAFGGSTTTFLFVGAAGASAYNVLLNTDGSLQFRFGTTAIGSASAPVSLNTWYRAEISSNIGSGSADDSGEFRLDGVTIASETNQTRSTTQPTRFVFGDGDATAASLNAFFDDGAINDDTGANQNNWPGSERVLLLRPISDNATGANWTEGAGGTGSLWDAVNNTPPTGVALASATNTSQIKNVAKDTTGNYDANLTSYTTAGIGATDTINVVQPVWLLGSSAASTVSHAMLLVSNPQANGGVESTFTPTAIAGTHPTNWFRQSPTAQTVHAPAVTMGTSPVIRVGKRTSSTSSAMVDAMGLLVGYTPATPKSFIFDTRRIQRNSLLRR